MASKRKSISTVWNFFEKLSCQEAECLQCGEIVKRAGSTSALFKHLERSHKKDKQQEPNTTHPYQQFLKLEMEEEEKKPNENASRKCRKTICGSSDGAGVVEVETTLSADVWTKWNPDDPPQMALDEKVLEMICLDKQPFSVVDGPGFRNLLHLAEPKFDLKSRKYYSKTLMPQVFEELKAKVAQVLASANSISITTDIESCDNFSLLRLTGHFIDDEFCRRKVLLLARPIDVGPTGQNLAEIFLEMLHKWRIENKLHTVLIRDGGSNMEKMCGIMRVPNFHCLAHCIQLVVNDGLSAQVKVQSLIKVGQKLSGFFHGSSLAKERLKVIQHNYNIPCHKLTQDSDTSWNCTKMMLEWLLEQRQALSLFSSEHGFHDIQLPTAEDWEIIENIINLLDPFEEFTKRVSLDSALVSEVIPLLNSFQRLLSRKDLHKLPGTQTMAIIFNQRVEKYLQNEQLICATYLDIRFKQYAFKMPQSGQTQAEELIKMAADGGEAQVLVESPPRKKSLSTEMDALIAQNSASPTRVCLDSSVPKELESFRTEPKIQSGEDPLNWWKLNRHRYPQLSKIAQRFLSAPPTRLCSAVGNIYTDKLMEKNAEALLFIKCNLKQV